MMSSRDGTVGHALRMPHTAKSEWYAIRNHRVWRKPLPAIASDAGFPTTASTLISLYPANACDEQIAALDSQLRRTLSRFCSIAWFHISHGRSISPVINKHGRDILPCHRLTFFPSFASGTEEGVIEGL